MGRRICHEFPVDKYHDPPAKRRAAQFGSKLNIRSSSELDAEYLIRGVGRAPMTETHRPDRLLPVRPPVCPDCRMPMRFATAERDRTYFKLRHAIFVCDCGRASDQLIAVVN
jgi:hypothetical protein